MDAGLETGTTVPMSQVRLQAFAARPFTQGTPRTFPHVQSALQAGQSLVGPVDLNTGL